MNSLEATYQQLLDAFNRMDWAAAVRLSTPLLAAAPGHPLVRFVAGVAELEQDRPSRAAEHLAAAVQGDPARLDFAAHHARALLAAGRADEARVAATQAPTAQARDPLALDVLGQVRVQTGDYESGLQAFSRAAELAPRQPVHHLNRASALIGLGRFDDAERALETCLSLAPHTWQAHYSLAQLRRWTPGRHHLDRLEALLPQAGRDPAAGTCLHLALAKEYEDLGRYPEAMNHLVAGKRAARPTRSYTPARDVALVDALIERFGSVPAPTANAVTQGPVFVVGMPRSGTTLVDRILSSHPQLHSAGELNTFGLALAQALGSPTPHLSADTVRSGPTVDWRALGTAYIKHARAATGISGRFSDKLPHNFLHLGAIARALPDARIVCLRRHPMDTCLSNFRQLFAASAPMMDYSYTLEDIGHYYVQFDRLMAHWERCLPGRLLSVSYEALIDDQEAVTRQLLDFCGLPWDRACLAFERNAAPVTTPSAVQVRSALHRESLERWKRYGPAMDSLHAILADAGLVA